MTDEAAVDPLDKLPKTVIYRNRKARIIGYDGSRYKKFEILDHQDQRRLVGRNEITFPKNHK